MIRLKHWMTKRAMSHLLRINHDITNTPRSQTTSTMNFLEWISILFGWVYTICWSASFYPQVLLNFSRKTTSGTTVDFPLLNVLGAPTSPTLPNSLQPC